MYLLVFQAGCLYIVLGGKRFLLNYAEVFGFQAKLKFAV